VTVTVRKIWERERVEGLKRLEREDEGKTKRYLLPQRLASGLSVASNFAPTPEDISWLRLNVNTCHVQITTQWRSQPKILGGCPKC